MDFDHILPLSPSLPCPPSLLSTPYPPNSASSTFLNSPLSPICIVQLLLGVRPVLECGHPTRGHTTKENLSLFLLAAIKDRELDFMPTSSHPMQGFCLAWAHRGLVSALWVHTRSLPAVSTAHCLLEVICCLLALSIFLKRLLSLREGVGFEHPI